VPGDAMRKHILAAISLISLVAACSSSNKADSTSTGGAGGDMGGTGGTPVAVGGTGGTPVALGGSGGTPVATGGTPAGGTGGMPAVGGGGTGGVPAVGGGGTGGTPQGGTGGTGGTGGQPAVDPCSHTTWVASAMPDHPLMYTPGDVPSRAIDGQAMTRWSSGLTQAGGEWFQVKFPSLVTISGVTLDTTASATDYPRGYSVEYSLDGTTFMPVGGADGGADGGLSGVGMAVTTIDFGAPLTLLAVRINQTGAVAAPATSWWSIHEFTVATCSKYTAPADAGAPDGGSVGDAGSDASDSGDGG
ncbi:MAG TPA: discoidin domain-containing protein, partial [Polyangiaceae bacterium]|nr:discoidin domain-containing protein [Polyangiaceae bacterium]